MTDSEFIAKILSKAKRLKQKTFVEKMRDDLGKYGGLTEGQLKVLKSIAAELGIFIEQPNKPLSDVEVSAPIAEIRGSCGECRDGLVLAWDKIKALFVFVCDCETGKKRPENFPNWQLFRHTKIYDLDVPGTNPRFDEKHPHLFPEYAEEKNSNSIFSPEEISEMFQFIKDSAVGKKSRQQINNYCEMIDSALKTKGIEPSAWRHLQEEN